VKVAIIQPSYFPWRGYFSIMAEVDTFVFLDDVQYTKSDWRNRNKFDINGDAAWLSIPIKSHSKFTKINEVEINNQTNWQQKHLRTFLYNYGRAPFFDDAYKIFSEIGNKNQDSLSTLTINTSKAVASYLNLQTHFITSSSLGIVGETPSMRLALITKELDGNLYLSGPTAIDYLEIDEFEKRKIEVNFKNHEYDTYTRGERKFLDYLSILDLISFHGPNSVDFL